MGSGKSTHGRYLAGRLGWSFYDLDAELEHLTGYSIAHFFSEYGEEAFRKKEHEILLEFCEKPGPWVLATGGGTPCFYDNMARMNAAGTTVYMRVPLEELQRRLLLEPTQQRPLLGGEEPMGEVLEKLLNQRRVWYEQARVECIG